MARRAFVAGAAIVVAIALVGCGVSIQVSAGVVDDSAYTTAWRAAWQTVDRDVVPWIPTSSSPGVCNIGGTKQGCYDTDQRVITDLEAMTRALTGRIVPAQFEQANGLLRQAIAITTEGLQLRDQAIADNDDAAFQRSGELLPKGHTLFQRSYEAFPDYDRPQPAPIL